MLEKWDQWNILGLKTCSILLAKKDAKMYHVCIHVTDGFVMNGATSVPKSVLRQVSGKGLTPIWNLASFLSPWHPNQKFEARVKCKMCIF